MPKQVTVILGQREYLIQEKSMGQHQVWRTRLKNSSVLKVFESLDEVMANLVEAVRAVPAGGGVRDLDVGKLLEVLLVLPAVVQALVNSIDEVTDLLFDYEPKLRSERKWLEANAYDEEVVAAFVEVLKIAFPFLAIWGLVAGPKAAPTSGSLASVNGASSGLPVSGPKKKTSTS